MRTLHIAPCILLLACGGSRAKQAGTNTMASETTNPVYRERPAEDGLILVEIDLNDDGVIDVYNYYRERAKAARLLVRKEIDLNHDARIDVWSFFDETGELIREDMDGDFDGKVDWVDHYQSSKRAMSEVDTNYDGQMDMFKYFENGIITRKERDTNGNGQIDFWEMFDDQGRVVKTGRDTTGDGIMDTRD